ncbi:MAG: hypothetical protein ACR2P3_10185, partial [Geminicoccaceae bacterium]
MVLEAGSIGLLVPRILGRPGSATVLAAFERSFYLEVGRDLVAIGAAALHDGPLNIRLRASGNGALTADLGIQPGQRWTIGQQRLQRDDGAIIALESASIWRPTAPMSVVDRDRLTRGLDRLRRHLTEIELPESGLIRLCLGGSTLCSPVERGGG